MLSIFVIIVVLVLTFNAGRLAERMHLAKYDRGRHETRVYVNADRDQDDDEVKVYSSKELGEMRPQRKPRKRGGSDWP